ncbi:MAG: hypothetical protein RLZZ609_2747 [Cyanobacteriota bacterium]|jgi:hypothetical protein
MKVVPPSIQKTAFSCPHCGAYTSQTWARLFADFLSGEANTPFIPDDEALERMRGTPKIPPEAIYRLEEYFHQMKQGDPFLERHENSTYLSTEIHNAWISTCFNCKRIGIWAHDRLVFPAMKMGPLPNADLPPEIRSDVEEARGIVELSPRGAAALLRLAIQKLCAYLGERGKNIDDDIASLVKKGLNPLVQQSLDVVRVIGNEAVHPGVIDLRDDRASAERLFDLVNIVAEQMITHPKSVREMYEKLPSSKIDAIQRRDGNSNSKKNA